MAEILQISQLGNPVLRRPSQVVENIKDDRIQQLIDSLIFTVQQANGVGIAAPQAAQSDRLFIVASRPNLRYPQAPSMEPTAMINPRIVAASTGIDRLCGQNFSTRTRPFRWNRVFRQSGKYPRTNHRGRVPKANCQLTITLDIIASSNASDVVNRRANVYQFGKRRENQSL
jgi:hypothetical protein